ncbi:tetratricopeptide repeat protein [Leptolyngbya sp. KIOST-1]|uniref:tetratricopeptide repeat protein n=1 Tax=Leptolyngbya sp. KIOST-1 TaxID=1229172 RepID=UPI0006898F30|nr:tetratricopeptide repeat protein [Leptolyngbya sp. KIOST-1]
MPFGKLFGRNKPSQPSPTSKPSPPEQVVSPWEAQNEDTIAELARFIDFAEGFTIGFVEISFPDDVDDLLKVLRRRPECRLTEFYVLDLSDPNLTYLQDELIQRINQIAPSTSLLMTPQRVILIKGLENSIGLFGDYPPVLQDLNFVRDALADSVPYPILFCLPSYAINRVIKFAPDFWSWKSGLFKVKSVQNSEDNASIRALYATKLLGSLSQLERQERVQLLERLVQEFSPLEGHRHKDDLRVCVKALIQLAAIHTNFDEYSKSEMVLDQTIKILDSPDWQPERLQDAVLRLQYFRWRGFLSLLLDDIVDAEASFKASLIINNEINEFEKGHILELLGRVEAKKGNLDKATTLYKQSLAIAEQISNAGRKAATLHSMAELQAMQGQKEEAIALFQQSLEIYDCIGNVQDKANTLHKLASIKAQQGQMEEAVALLHLASDLEERIGNAQGKANTLHTLASIKAQQGQMEEAIALLQQSLEILECIGSPDAATVQAHLEQAQTQVEEMGLANAIAEGEETDFVDESDIQPLLKGEA